MSEPRKFRTGCAPALTVWANTSKDGEKMYFNLVRSKYDKETNKYTEDGKVTLFAQDFAALAMLAPQIVAAADEHFANRRAPTATTPAKTSTNEGLGNIGVDGNDDDNIPF